MTTESIVSVDDLKKEGLIKSAPRTQRSYQSKRMTGFNQEVYSAWIERWANSSAINYPIISDSWGIRFLFNSCKNIPALVVGIGPSFDDNINALKIVKQRCILIATDAALRPLLRHGIKPDIVVNYDGRHEQKTMWETIDTSDLVLVANSITSPKTVDAWKGKQLFFNAEQADDEFATNILPAMYPHLGGLPNMGTVGNGAIFLAHKMGCAPILTVGMDLCYREMIKPRDPLAIDWRYRCKDWEYGLFNSENSADVSWRQIENKTLYENTKRMADTFDQKHKDKTFRVDEALKYYANSLLSNIGQLDLPVIDCSGGVLAQYIKHMPLEEALLKKCPETIYDGRTVVRHLNKIVPDGKRGRIYHENDFWKLV